MAQRNVEAVQQIFAEWSTGDFSAEPRAFDPHIVFVVRDDFPEPGAVLGVDGIKEYMRRFLAQFQHTTFEATGFREAGDTVLVQIVQRATGISSGLQGELAFFMLFTFRGAKVIRIESVMHESEALEAAGLAESRSSAGA